MSRYRKITGYCVGVLHITHDLWCSNIWIVYLFSFHEDAWCNRGQGLHDAQKLRKKTKRLLAGAILVGLL